MPNSVLHRGQSVETSTGSKRTTLDAFGYGHISKIGPGEQVRGTYFDADIQRRFYGVRISPSTSSRPRIDETVVTAYLTELAEDVARTARDYPSRLFGLWQLGTLPGGISWSSYAEATPSAGTADILVLDQVIAAPGELDADWSQRARLGVEYPLYTVVHAETKRRPARVRSVAKAPNVLTFSADEWDTLRALTGEGESEPT